MTTPNFREPGEFEEFIDWAEFQELIKFGEMDAFVDGEGVAFLATETQVSNVVVTPSRINSLSFVRPSWATHVIWYWYEGVNSETRLTKRRHLKSV